MFCRQDHIAFPSTIVQWSNENNSFAFLGLANPQLPKECINSHLFIQQIFIEQLLCASGGTSRLGSYLREACNPDGEAYK